MPLVLFPVATAGHGLTEMRNSWDGTRRQRRWPSDQFAETPKVLGNGGKRELELGTAWPPQSEPAEAENALQVREQHLDLLTIAICLRIRYGPDENRSGCMERREICD
jgi:hypothetical protein